MLMVLDKALLQVVGRYTEEQLRVLPTRRPRRQHPSLEARIEATWRRRTREASSAGHELWNGHLARLVSHGALGDRLHLFVGETTFREFVGTNLEADELRDSLGEEYFANPLGVSAAVLTPDDTLLLGRRSGAVAEGRGQWDLPGGHVSFDPRQGCLPFDAMRQELREELGLGPDDLDALVCVGLMESTPTHKPELLFLCRTRERARRLLKRVRAAGDSEHDDFECVPAGKEQLFDLLRMRGEELTPVAAGGIGALVS